MRKIFSIVLVLFLIILLIPQKTFATSQDFQVFEDSVYQMLDDNNVLVTEQFKILNLTSNSIPKKYITKLGKLSVYNPQAFDSTGKLPLTLHVNNDDSNLEIELIRPQAGVNKETSWTQSYLLKNILITNGQLTTLTLPIKDNDYTPTGTISVVSTKHLGKPIVVQPPSDTYLSWTRNKLRSPIQIQFQPIENNNIYYEFDFVYRLINKSLQPTMQTIVLPPSLQSQKVFFNKLTPFPNQTLNDEDGNLLVKFRLGMKETLDVKINGIFEITSLKNSADLKFLNEHQKADAFWESENSQVEKLANKLTTIDQIYTFLVNDNSLSLYDKPRHSRQGGKNALSSNDSMGCLDLTDSFITLSRANGIPTRAIDGLIFPNHHVLSCWVEYYDINTTSWHPLDPFLAKTNPGWDFKNQWDKAHLTLAIRGKKSALLNMPLIQTIVKPITHKPQWTNEHIVTINAHIPKNILAGTKFTPEIHINNLGPGRIDSMNLLVKTEGVRVKSENLTVIDLPPFSSKKVTIPLVTTHWNESKNAIINLTVGQNTYKYAFVTYPFYKSNLIVIIISLAAITFIFIVTQISRSLLFQR